MRIGFTGTRNGCTKRQLDALKFLIKGLNCAENLEAGHGSCLGADSEFHELCLAEKIPVDLFPGFFKGRPNDLSCRANLSGERKTHDAAPMLERNDKIVKWADLIVGCPATDLTDGQRGGTYYTIHKAMEEGVQTIVLFP